MTVEVKDELKLQGTIAVSFPIHAVEGVFGHLSPLREIAHQDGVQSRRRLIFVDAMVWAVHGEQIAAYFDVAVTASKCVVVSTAEGAKSEAALRDVVAEIDRFNPLRRSEPIIVIGGGVLMDVVGFACSMYRRGVPYIRVPTTLIGQIDAGVGIKTGINLGGTKNRLGAYYAPIACVNDRMLLATLPERQISSGLAEALKIAITKDATLFDLIELEGRDLISERMAGEAAGEIMMRAIRGMVEELECNLTEHALERLVDFGHTFSPSFELATGMLHGEAVALDMAISCTLAQGRGLLRHDAALRAIDLFHTLGLPIDNQTIDHRMLAEALADTTRHRNGRQRMALPIDIGRAIFVNDVTAEELENALVILRAAHELRR